jgi:hypothetical protein
MGSRSVDRVVNSLRVSFGRLYFARPAINAYGRSTRLYKLQRMQGEPLDPKQNGFDLTLDQIKLHITRQHLKTTANIAESCGWAPQSRCLTSVRLSKSVENQPEDPNQNP